MTNQMRLWPTDLIAPEVLDPHETQLTEGPANAACGNTHLFDRKYGVAIMQEVSEPKT